MRGRRPEEAIVTWGTSRGRGVGAHWRSTGWDGGKHVCGIVLLPFPGSCFLFLSSDDANCIFSQEERAICFFSGNMIFFYQFPLVKILNAYQYITVSEIDWGGCKVVNSAILMNFLHLEVRIICFSPLSIQKMGREGNINFTPSSSLGCTLKLYLYLSVLPPSRPRTIHSSLSFRGTTLT